MRVIIINDDDGHASAVEATPENLKGCLKAWVDCGQCDDEDWAQGLIEKPDATAQELEDFINRNCPTDRSGGHRCYIVDVEKNWDFNYGPWG